jgi:acyl dehydratase
VGMGRDPLDQNELAYVYEGRGLKTVPAMATVIGRIGGGMEDLSVTYALVLHGEQRVTLHRPLPPAAELITDSRVRDIFDKGEGKGAVIIIETEVRLAADHAPLCTLVSTVIARGDGGFGGPEGSGPEPHRIPERKADETVLVETRPDQALLYRLSGDRNPLHADPVLARKAGFQVPILHGLCTYGNACRAILKSVCAYDHTRIKDFDVRFSAPVFPGDMIAVDLWQDAETISFRCHVPARGVTVINNGRCLLGPSTASAAAIQG